MREIQGDIKSGIIENIKSVFHCDEKEIEDFHHFKDGLMNTSFVFRVHGEDYVYRHPGEGTKELVNRSNEKDALIKACKAGFDPTYIHADAEQGWKISHFVPEFRVPEYGVFEDAELILAVIRKLHHSGITADSGIKPWEDILETEQKIEALRPDCLAPYKSLKQKVEILYQKTIHDGVEKCFCHGDTYKYNWMICPDNRVILIDWEYAGFSDPAVDVCYYIVDAQYDFPEADRFIRAYLGDEATPAKVFHFMAYTAIIAYFWLVWALYREASGAYVGPIAENWYKMAVKYSEYLTGSPTETGK